MIAATNSRTEDTVTTQHENSLQDDILAVQNILSVPTILDVVCRITGMGFAAIARVTDDRWIACSVKDDIAFGLKAGGELERRNHHLQ